MNKPKIDSKFRKKAAAVIIFCMLVLAICNVMKVDITNVLVPILEEQYGWTRVQVNVGVTAGSYIAIATGFVAGCIIIRTGIKKVFVCGMAGMLIGTFLIALSGQLSGMCVGFALCQAAYPVLLLSAQMFITNWYIRRRGWALGVMTIAFPLMSAIYAQLGNLVIAPFGKQVFYSGVGIVIIVVCVLICVFLKENPEDIGLSADGLVLTEEEKAALANRKADPANKTKVKELLLCKEGILMIIGNTALRFMMIAIIFHMILRMVDVGIERPRAAMFMTIISVIGIFTSYIWGVLDDKVGTVKVLRIFSASYIVGAIFILFMTANTPALIVCTVIFASSLTGGLENLKASIVSYVYGRKNFASVNRFVALVSDIGSAFAFTFMTVMYAKFGTYNNSYIVMIVIAIIALACYFGIRKTYDPERLALIEDKKRK